VRTTTAIHVTESEGGEKEQNRRQRVNIFNTDEIKGGSEEIGVSSG